MPEALLAGIAAVAFFGIMLVVAISDDAEDRENRDKAFQQADRLCGGPGRAQSVGIKGENRIAYVCIQDGPLKRLSY